MPTRAASVLALIMLATAGATAADKSRLPPPPDFVIGRHTFLDFGPPSDFYEIFSVRSTEGGSTIERLTLTPPGDRCFQPPTAEAATATVPNSVSTLLGDKNPCSLPERALSRERARRKNLLVFSGANVVMQVRCGDHVRRFRMEILDRDLYDAAPRTPEHTSWTMEVLRRLNEPLGPGVMARPLFTFMEPAAIGGAEPSTIAEPLKRGAFDRLFEKTPHILSALYEESQQVAPQPSVELLTSSPFRPLPGPAMPYPAIARLAHLEGDVSFTLTVTSEGGASDFTSLTGPPLLQKAVGAHVAQWRFPPEAAGRLFEGVAAFRTNCPAPSR